MRHSIDIRRGRHNGKVEYAAYCVKECGWVGSPFSNYRAAENEGDDHVRYMARIGEEEGPVSDNVEEITWICDQLDVEEDDHLRSDLLVRATVLADEDEECAEIWKGYR